MDQFFKFKLEDQWSKIIGVTIYLVSRFQINYQENDYYGSERGNSFRYLKAAVYSGGHGVHRSRCTPCIVSYPKLKR